VVKGNLDRPRSLAILEAAVLECKKRDIDTLKVRAALDLLEPYIRPAWLIPQFRHHVFTESTDSPGDREGQQQVLRVTSSGIRDSSSRSVRGAHGFTGAEVGRDSRHESEG
jgi:hypothetical protein